MATVSDVASVIKTGEAKHFGMCDGYCSGADFVWLESRNVWLWACHDSHRTGTIEKLYFIFSESDGDESGLNSIRDLIAAELDGNVGTWVVSELPDDFEFADDDQIFELGDPDKGLVPVEMESPAK
jgi:hypothetical protein